jgi:hypothetical protein
MVIVPSHQLVTHDPRLVPRQVPADPGQGYPAHSSKNKMKQMGRAGWCSGERLTAVPVQIQPRDLQIQKLKREARKS